jgi:hypothetical protein
MFLYKEYSQFIPPRQGKRIYVICLMFVSTLYLHSMENNGRGTKAIGMANAFVAVSDNIWAINYNPAGLTQITDIQCSAFMIPCQFGLSELRTSTFAAAVPFTFAVLALKAEKFGYDLYKETEIGMSFALNFNPNVSGGLSINFHRFDIARYGSTQNIILNGGVLARLLNTVRVGFNFNNLSGSTIGQSDEKIPQQLSFGFCWSAVKDLLLSFEIEKDIRFPESIKFGVEQKVFGALAFQAGVSNKPEKYSAGFTVKFLFFEFGYAGYSHVDLGWTHQIEITF